MMSLGLSGYSIAAPDAAPDAAPVLEDGGGDGRAAPDAAPVLEDGGGDGRAAPDAPDALDAPELSLGGMKIEVFLLYIVIYYIL
jgi:hypothetical protein